MDATHSRLRYAGLGGGLVVILAVASGSLALAGDWKTAQPARWSQSGEYHVIKVLNQDQFEGKWKQFKGDLKKQWGKFTDDDLMEIEGNYDKFEGKLQERYGKRKEEVRKWADEWYEKHGKNK
jgi:uncharacterized protein YjbJ (UPF0337 family)